MTFLRSNDGLVCAAWAAAACLLAMVAAPAYAQAAGPVVQQPDTVFLEELTWTELRAGIQAGKTTIIVPIGGTEQNGPHMALGKHNARVRTLAERVARTLGDAFVAPVIAYVPEGALQPATGHMRFPGTITVPDDVFRRGLESMASATSSSSATTARRRKARRRSPRVSIARGTRSRFALTRSRPITARRPSSSASC